jgi:hypothetical protein
VDEALGRGAGGIGSLHRLLTEHGEAIEADLRRYYTLSLTDLATGALSIRQLVAYLRHLPRGSALHTAIAGHDWTTGDFLLADLYGTWAGERHPMDPREMAKARRMREKLRDLKRRRAKRKQQLNS